MYIHCRWQIWQCKKMIHYDLPSEWGPTPPSLKPRRVSGPPRKNLSLMATGLSLFNPHTVPQAADNWTTYQHTHTVVSNVVILPINTVITTTDSLLASNFRILRDLFRRADASTRVTCYGSCFINTWVSTVM